MIDAGLPYYTHEIHQIISGFHIKVNGNFNNENRFTKLDSRNCFKTARAPSTGNSFRASSALSSRSEWLSFSVWKKNSKNISFIIKRNYRRNIDKSTVQCSVYLLCSWLLIHTHTLQLLVYTHSYKVFYYILNKFLKPSWMIQLGWDDNKSEINIK